MRLDVRYPNLKLIFCFVFLVLGGTAYSQIGNISIENKVDIAKVTIGDLITYSLTVTHDDTVEVQLPGRAFVVVDSAGHILPDDALNISDYQIREPAEIDGEIVEGVDYVFSPFLVGEFTVASLTVLFKMPKDTAYYRINAEPIQIEVQSLKPSESGDIRDIKSQWEVDRDFWLLWRPIVISLIAIFVIILGIIMYKRWRAGKALLPILEKPKRPPHEIALAALDELVKSDLLASGEIKAFYSELSDIVRRYIEGRYFVVAIEMTTEQLISNLRNTEVDTEIIELIRELLMPSDMVKFAKYSPGEAESLQSIGLAYEIINKTKIIWEPEPETDLAERTEESATDNSTDETDNTDGLEVEEADEKEPGEVEK